MNNVDRLDLLNTIGRELQNRFTFSEIDTYFNGFDIDLDKDWSGVNSKWRYSKEMLADEPNEVILKIADELEIPHNFGSNTPSLNDSKFWLPNHFRLFLSHLSSFKKKTSILKETLKKYGISSFVAHEDITPTKEWQIEIEKSLFSMDALAAILTNGFSNSNWTDQEVGIAMGRNILVIPIKKGNDPYGFFGKYQALQAKGKTIKEVADSIFQIIIENSKTKDRISECLTNQILSASNSDTALKKLELINRIEEISVKYLETIQNNLRENEVLINSEEIIEKTNRILEKKSLGVVYGSTEYQDVEDDLPF